MKHRRLRRPLCGVDTHRGACGRKMRRGGEGLGTEEVGAMWGRWGYRVGEHPHICRLLIIRASFISLSLKPSSPGIHLLAAASASAAARINAAAVAPLLSSSFSGAGRRDAHLIRNRTSSDSRCIIQTQPDPLPLSPPRAGSRGWPWMRGRRAEDQDAAARPYRGYKYIVREAERVEIFMTCSRGV